MHILLLDKNYSSPEGRGRARSHEIAARWIKGGHKVTVIGCSVDPLDASGADPLVQDGMSVIALPRHLDGRAGFVARVFFDGLLWFSMLYRAFRIGHVDVVFVGAAKPSILLVLAGYLASRKSAAPLVCEITDLRYDPAYPESHVSSIRRFCRSALDKISFQLADHSILASPAMEAAVLDAGISPQNLSVVSEGCDVDLFHVPADHGAALLKAHPNLSNAPLIVLEGALNCDQAAAVLIKLATAMLDIDPESRFVVCGDGPAKSDIRAMAAHSGVLEKNLWILPALPRLQMPQLYAAATVIVSLRPQSPSYTLAAPMPVFDALAAGRPLVMNHGGWHAALVQSRGAGITVDASDFDSAAQDLSDFVRDREALRRSGEQALALAESKFNRDKLTGELRSILEALHHAQPAAERRRKRSLVVKRTVDLVVSLAALIILSPIILAVSVVLFFNMGRPIFFRQIRPGLHGKPFTLLKFRTMTEETDEGGNLLPDTERLTPLGRFLRRTSLDEVPGLIDVLLGDMSLVGPRPLLMEYLPYYSAEQARRHSVPPGITGWAQINGRNALTWEEKFELDVWYVENRTLWLDIKILLRTFWVVITGQGVSPLDQESMPRFDEIMARRQGAEDI